MSIILRTAGCLQGRPAGALARLGGSSQGGVGWSLMEGSGGGVRVKSGFVFPILRHHHAQRGDAEDPPASETFCRPTSHCSSPCPLGSFRLVLRLTAPRTSPTRLRPLPWGGPPPPPSPAPSAAPPARPAGARVPYPFPWQRLARPHACAPVSRSCALSHRVHPSQPPSLRSASSVARAFVQVSSSSHRLFNSSHRL